MQHNRYCCLTLAIVAASILLSHSAKADKVETSDCYITPAEAIFQKIIKLVPCRTRCDGCGCQTGPGYRRLRTSEPPEKKPPCVGDADLGRVCGPFPHANCTRECTPRVARCATKPIALGGNITSQLVQGQDRDGGKAAFDILLLLEGITWEKGSNKSFRQDPFGPSLLKQTVQARLADARELIAIGVASFEGERPKEERRGMDRAREISRRMAEIFVPKKRTWLLNLGQNTIPTTGDSGHQRPVLIVGVLERDERVNLAEALRSVLEQKEHAILNLDEYSRFDLMPDLPAEQDEPACASSKHGC